MSEEHTQPVLRCLRCKKPFDKQSTLKRHGYYCRSRNVGGGVRSRSCYSCAKGKARCDNKQPNCSRCTTKGIECHYPAAAPKSIALNAHDGVDGSSGKSIVTSRTVAQSSDGEHDLAASLNSESVFDVVPDRSAWELAGLAWESLAWDDFNFGSPADMSLQASEGTMENILPSPNWSPLWSWSSSSVSPSTSVVDQAAQSQIMASSQLSLIRPSNSALRSLVMRPNSEARPERVSKLIFNSLKCYPQMMLDHKNLPPFIHSHIGCIDTESGGVESLKNCISLVHMISNRFNSNRKLFWRNVRMECARMCEEHSNFDRWELLAAMQALTIYIIIRLDEGETDHNNLDALLLAAVIAIAQQINRVSATFDTETASHKYDLEGSWKDWIFEESVRRVCVVYKVLNLLVFFEPAAMCDLKDDLVIAPLPARKHLWEAGDKFSWKVETERGPKLGASFALAAGGELVALLHESRIRCSERMLNHGTARLGTPSGDATSWESWCSGMDGFGALVMLAASLVE